MNDINVLIGELTAYGVRTGLIPGEDRVLCVNRLIELFEIDDYKESRVEVERPLCDILNDILDHVVSKGLISEDTIARRDLFDTKIMGMITPQPSYVRREFRKRYGRSSVEATDWYYDFSRATNYIRTDRIEKDEKWETPTEYGNIGITINLSKPEKDPRDIAAAGKAVSSGYPRCLLCAENEGYAGHISHPARQNHRIIPIKLCGSDYFLQYSPYVYYNEHCIVFNKEHIPMAVNRQTFEKLLDFVRQFPHYMVGSNADLPIVGGSILSHDHFQGGRYEFPMAKAPIDKSFELPGHPAITAGIVKWPMSVIRLSGENADDMASACDMILAKWRDYTDEAAFIYAQTDGTPHNTITPIARMRGGRYEMDLVLRNNITTDEHPMGVYHPHSQYHHIKKENIGLIEVMGLAILPARLKTELSALESLIRRGGDPSSDADLAKHADWVKGWIDRYEAEPGRLNAIIKDEVGKTFVKILECAGVYKASREGQEAFDRFIGALG